MRTRPALTPVPLKKKTGKKKPADAKPTSIRAISAILMSKTLAPKSKPS